MIQLFVWSWVIIGILFLIQGVLIGKLNLRVNKISIEKISSLLDSQRVKKALLALVWDALSEKFREEIRKGEIEVPRFKFEEPSSTETVQSSVYPMKLRYKVEIVPLSVEKGSGYVASAPKLGQGFFVGTGDTPAQAVADLEASLVKWFEFHSKKTIGDIKKTLEKNE